MPVQHDLNLGDFRRAFRSLDQQQATWKIGLTFLTGDQLEYRRQEFRAEFFVCDFHVRHPWTVKRPDEGEA